MATLIKSYPKILDSQIAGLQKRIDSLTKKKQHFLDVAERFSDIDLDFTNGYFHTSSDIHSKITCLNLHFNYDTITAQFFISPKKTNGYKIFLESGNKYLKNNFIVANITRQNYSTKERIITINNYDNFVSDSCPFKKRFLKRIKLYLFKKIDQYKLSVSKNSFNYEQFNRLMMLK